MSGILREGGEGRKVSAMSLHRAWLTHPLLPCAVLLSSPQKGRTLIEKGSEKVIVCDELMGLSEELVCELGLPSLGQNETGEDQLVTLVSISDLGRFEHSSCEPGSDETKMWEVSPQQTWAPYRSNTNDAIDIYTLFMTTVMTVKAHGRETH